MADEGVPRKRADSGADPDLGVALTPRQIRGGIARLAALVMLLRRRSRDRDRAGRG
jgi:hypothetical protein